MIEVFNNYTKNYDLNDEKIKLKYYHSFRVMELSEKIARFLYIFTEEEINIIKLIGLFHDIGRFEQIRKYNTFNDDISIDHGGLSTEILFDQGILRQIINNPQYDDVIKTAIYVHNKKEIPDYYDEKLKTYCKIIRDADKIDILKICAEDETNIMNIDNYPEKKLYEDFINQKMIDRKQAKTNADWILYSLCYIYDINYKYSFAVIKDNDYINKYVNIQNYSNDEIKDFYIKIGKSLTEFIIKQL